MKTMLRSAILAVAAVAVVGTTLTSTANAGQLIGRFDYGTTPARPLRLLHHVRINHGLPCNNLLGNKCFAD